MLRTLLLAMLAICVPRVSTQSSKSLSTEFSHQLVRLCLRPQFLHDLVVASPSNYRCATTCLARGSQCQGFRLRTSGCQTFEFDRCSHMVNQANCNLFEWIYVRKQNGLPHGQMCPGDYGNGYYGSTYKMIDTTSWTQALNYCSSQPGLTKFADAFDKAEAAYFHSLKATLNGYLSDWQRSFYVGGYRIGDSVTGTWFWRACNVAFVPEVWDVGQPNEGDSHFRSDIWYDQLYGLDDEVESSIDISRALCECINPFV